MARLDHVILRVNDLEASVRFYVDVLGFLAEGTDGPFTVIRVGEDCILQLAPFGTDGHEHYAFALSRPAFDAAFARIRAQGLEYGDAFDAVGSNRGPGVERGARGEAPTVYLFDPNRHLIEIRTYD